MEYKKIKLNLDEYKGYYKSIHGGIDGYYENMILYGECFIVNDSKTLAYFTIHEDRGLTSLVVLEGYEYEYSRIFDYVFGLNLFDKVLFTEKDTRFLEELQKRDCKIDVQSYNFEVLDEVESEIEMMPTTILELELIQDTFSEFIEYNNMNLREMVSFYWMEEDEVIAFGGLEPMELNENRFCISMIVKEKYRGKGYGSEVVKYLIEFLQLNELEANARCYVKNEVSKKTLLKAGMSISNKLYKVENIRG